VISFDEALQRLGTVLSLPIEPSAEGTVQLLFDGELPLVLEAQGEYGVYLYSILGNVPPEGVDTLFASLLSAQYFGRETGEACFGLDTRRRELLLHRQLNLRKHDFNEFRAAVERFVAAARLWSRRLSGGLQASEGLPLATDPPQPDPQSAPELADRGLFNASLRV
jgi:hypothetical protein